MWYKIQTVQQSVIEYYYFTINHNYADEKCMCEADIVEHESGCNFDAIVTAIKELDKLLI